MAKPKRRSPPKPAAPAPVLTRDEGVWWRDPVLWALTALGAALLLWNLGGRCLWQDEAETALLGRNILQYGKPLAFDGINYVSQEASHEFGPDHVWRWSPWVQFYLAAGGLKTFGETTLGARLPFAILAIFVVPLTYLLARRAYESILVARFAALAQATAVWFLLHARQSRWHAPAYVLACVVLLAVFEVERRASSPVEGDRRGRLSLHVALLAVAGAALFYTNYFVAICFLVAIAIASPLLARDRAFFLRLGIGLAGAALLSLPGVIFFNVLGKTGGGQSSAWTQFWIYVVQFFTFLAPLPLVAVAAIADGARPVTRFLLGLSVATCVMLALAPWTMFRYLTILYPVASLLAGLALAWLVRRNAIAGWIAAALFVWTSILHQLPLAYMQVDGSKQADARFSPLAAYLGEVIAPPGDTECRLAGYLRANAHPGETVLATYGDLPLQFYTRMHVAGGMQGQPLPAAPDWLIGRSFYLSTEPGKDYSVLRFINTQIDVKRYELVTSMPDPGIAGNPDPLYHWFRDQPDARPARVLRRR
jgi:4-amino-4-deoxy-L-arabinose transferase-like glycosyltransferase